MNMDARMYMSINWDYHVSFVYRTWRSETVSEFIIGLLVTLLFSIIIVGVPLIKSYAIQQNSFYLKMIWQMFFVFQSAMIMFLLMTVNGYVCLTIALGSGIGHYLFFPLIELAKKQEQKLLLVQDLSQDTQ